MPSNQKINYNDLFESLEQNGTQISPELRIKITDRLNQILSYEPKVGVFGKTGVGKSSLCNALFGQDICEISDIKACTRKPQEVLLTIGGKGIKLLDVPGVGESSDRDNEYEELYENLLPELDLIFWVFKADDRAASSDERFYKRLIRPYVDAGKPFLAVINQVDKIEPFREWDEEAKRPSIKQAKNIDEKRAHISSFLDLPLNKVIPISANESYGLMELVDSIIHELPNDKKIIMLEKIKKAEEENIARVQAEAEIAKAEAEKARAEAEIAKAEAEKAKTEQEKAKAEAAKLRAEADAEKAKIEAEKAKAEAERIKQQTKVSSKAQVEAQEGFLETVKKVVTEVAIYVAGNLSKVTNAISKFFSKW